MDNIRRQYFIVENDQDNSEVINRWIDHDGQMMKWACKIFDKAMKEESKKLVPFEKYLFYFFVNDQKIIVSYENTGFIIHYNLILLDHGYILRSFDTFYELLKYLYRDEIDSDIGYVLPDLIARESIE